MIHMKKGLPSRTLFHFCNHVGEILIFDNQRVLHGRTGFEDNHRESRVEQSSESGNQANQSEDEKFDRFLQGCYFDWDQIFWKIRPIKRRIENARANQIKEPSL